MRTATPTITLGDMDRTSSRHRYVVASIAVCTVGLLSGVVAGPFATSGAAVAKKTTPPKSKPAKTTVPAKTTIPKRDPQAPKTVKQPNGKKVADNAAGRDKFCDALVVFRATLISNLNLPGNENLPLDKLVDRIATANNISAQVLGDSAHLPILKWATLDAANGFIAAIKSVKPQDNPKEALDAVVAAIVEGLDGFTILNSYAVTRCNVMLYLNEKLEIDGPPGDADTVKLFAAYEKTARETAVQVFPPAPPAGKKWPRAALYNIEDAPPTSAAP
jgi:hypothetical protein